MVISSDMAGSAFLSLSHRLCWILLREVRLRPLAFDGVKLYKIVENC